MKTAIMLSVFIFSTCGFAAIATASSCENELIQLHSSTAKRSYEYKRIVELSNREDLSPTVNGMVGSLHQLAFALLESNAYRLLEVRTELIRKTNEAAEQLTGRKLIAPFKLDSVKASIASGEIQISVQKIQEIKSSKLDIYEAGLTVGGLNLVSFQFRSNGYVAFLNNSYEYRSAEIADYNGAYIDGGAVKTFSTGKLILSTLNDVVELSRSMGDKERNMWLSQDLDRLGSPMYNGKVHFAFKYCFFKCPPYVVRVPKALLFELFEKRWLEINTFESRESLLDGMPAWAATDAGINVEFVFSKRAIEQLAPFISPQLRSEPINSGRG